MVQIDIPTAFVVSMFSIDIGRRALLKAAEDSGADKPTLYYRYLVRTLFIAGFIIAPAGIYLLSGWPGWEQIYWSRRFEEVVHTGWGNALLPAFFIMAIVLGAYLGHVLGYRWLTTGKAKYIRPTYIGVLALVAVVVLSTYPSFTLMGTYDQYHSLNGQTRDAMQSVFDNPYGFSVAWLGVMAFVAAGLGWLLLRIRKDNQELGG